MKPSENAITYIGQMEKKGNSGFMDQSFEKEMKEEGWENGWAWCSIFCKVVFKNCFPAKSDELNKLFSASAVKTFENFRAAGYPFSQIPTVDALVIWQNQKDGKPQWTGHAGIVVSVNGDTFESVEGNTNDVGGREGYIVARRTRKVIHNIANGLEILGFIKI